MGTKQKRLIIVSAVALAGLLGVWTLPTTGMVEPNEPPHSTKQMLEEIYEAVVLGPTDVSQKEGYFKSIEVLPDTTETFFTVPAGKRFVLLKLFLSSANLSLSVDDNIFIYGWSFPRPSENGRTCEDFPDRCVVLNAGETLKAYNAHASSRHGMTLIGYFEEVGI